MLQRVYTHIILKTELVFITNKIENHHLKKKFFIINCFNFSFVIVLQVNYITIIINKITFYFNY